MIYSVGVKDRIGPDHIPLDFNAMRHYNYPTFLMLKMVWMGIVIVVFIKGVIYVFFSYHFKLKMPLQPAAVW